MVATFTAVASTTKLADAHYNHLLDEGFTPEQIAICEGWGVRSLSPSESKLMKLGNHSGLYFPFSQGYGQIRLDKPVDENGQTKKYLGPWGTATAAWVRPNVRLSDCEVGTEGWKDAAMPTLLGVTTAAFVGVDSIPYSVPRDCKMTIVFDSDGWRKHTVMTALISAAIWTQGSIALFPTMPDYPTGGACEFFKIHGDRTDVSKVAAYRQVLKSAMSPSEFLEAWLDKVNGFDLAGMFGGKSHEQNYADSIKAAYESVHKLNQANAWVKVMQAKVDAHRKQYGLV
ncbi:hypothetical protein H6F75_00325 [Nodosilinea sp. FACHB-131]|uniref:hypothetical protein n=1 Tax=Cyanophyceae TaxID=3028117 RepID=UPI001684BBCE|nr:hypothetical protein [Nodosilinea sp. FACHB-131]MBD1871915.1 hypothetical protein [Nodosilinea sp. FACHB-131]